MSGPHLIQMNEAEFAEFLETRERLRNLFSWLGRESQISKLSPNIRYTPTPVLAIQLPNSTELFTGRGIDINLAEEEWKIAAGFLKYFPETTSLFARREGVDPSALNYNPMPFEEEPFSLEILEAALAFPQLAIFVADGGRFSSECMAALSKHPSIRTVGLGRCQIAPDDFSEMENLRSLEILSVITGASPEWFVTLAKLPQFRSFSISGRTLGEVDLNQPIDDETRRAIESLNGRLEEFHAYDTYGLEVHPDIARALLQVKSLKKLNIYVGRGLVVDDLKELLNMPNLVDQGFFTTPDNWGDDDKTASEMINQARIMAEKRRLAARSSNEP